MGSTRAVTFRYMPSQDGWKDWINTSLRSPLRAAPHAMAMPRATNAKETAGVTGVTDAKKTAAVSEMVRLWYGRMDLPPADALLPPHGVRFSYHRTAEARAVGVEDPLANARELQVRAEPRPTVATGRGTVAAGTVAARRRTVAAR